LIFSIYWRGLTDRQRRNGATGNKEKRIITLLGGVPHDGHKTQSSTASKEIREKLEQMEKKYDAQFKVVFDALRQLLTPPGEPKKNKVGFGVEQMNVETFEPTSFAIAREIKRS
jgi:hypothetical protein